jgi:hypothetical protein
VVQRASVEKIEQSTRPKANKNCVAQSTLPAGCEAIASANAVESNNSKQWCIEHVGIKIEQLLNRSIRPKGNKNLRGSICISSRMRGDYICKSLANAVENKKENKNSKQFPIFSEHKSLRVLVYLHKTSSRVS